MASVQADRAAFAVEHPHCWCCGGSWQVWVHEMVRGGSREAALPVRAAWFAACWHCNSGPLNDRNVWPLARQLAMKWVYDRRHFDLPLVCQLRREAPSAVTMTDVIPHICRALDERKETNYGV
jgi:hypothetical protein